MPALPPPVHARWKYSRIRAGRNSRDIRIDDSIRELAQSIEHQGLLQPLGVIDRPEDNLIYGFRRFAALSLLDLEEISVLVYPGSITTAQVRAINLTENIQRTDLTDPEIFRACQELMTLNPEWQRQDLAKHLGKDPSTVTRYLSPSDLVPEALGAFLAAEFGFAKAYSIAKSPDQLATLALVRGGETRDSLERRTRKAKASSAPAVRSSSLRFPISTGHVVAIKGDEISLEEAVEVLSTALKDVKRGIADHLTAKTFQSAARDKAAAG